MASRMAITCVNYLQFTILNTSMYVRLLPIEIADCLL